MVEADASFPTACERVRAEVAAAARRLAADGLVLGTAGNVSARVDEAHVAVTATGAVLSEATAAEVTVVRLGDGRPIDGGLEPTSELDLHLGVYRRHPGSGAVVHTHAPVATSLACVLTDELPCVHYTMLALGGAVPVAPYRTFGTAELAAVTLDALEGKAAALMANHGTINHGPTLDVALEGTRLLEWAATVYWRARSIGTPRTLGDDELQAVVAAVVQRGYGTTRPAATVPA